MALWPWLVCDSSRAHPLPCVLLVEAFVVLHPSIRPDPALTALQAYTFASTIYLSSGPQDEEVVADSCWTVAYLAAGGPAALAVITSSPALPILVDLIRSRPAGPHVVPILNSLTRICAAGSAECEVSRVAAQDMEEPVPQNTHTRTH